MNFYISLSIKILIVLASIAILDSSFNYFLESKNEINKIYEDPKIFIYPKDYSDEIDNWFSVQVMKDGMLHFRFGESYRPFPVDMKEFSKNLDMYDLFIYNNNYGM